MSDKLEIPSSIEKIKKFFSMEALIKKQLFRPMVLVFITVVAVVFSELLIFLQLEFFGLNEYHTMGYWLGFWTPLIDSFFIGGGVIFSIGLYEKKLKEEKDRIEQSIEYASLIQEAMRPKTVAYEHFKEYFIFLKERDRVGGDFYSIVPISEDKLLVMVIDGVGHGVSGAFVTMFAKAIEYQIVTELKQGEVSFTSSAILGRFNALFKRMMEEHDASKALIGFDGGVLCYNKQEKVMSFSGAKMPLYIVENGVLDCYKGDRKGVGFTRTSFDYAFSEYSINVSKNMRFYLASDGIFDQNSKDDSTYGKARLEEILIKESDQPLQKQGELIVQSIEKFKGKKAQLDDMLLLGFSLDV